jgi:hypothetical protein
MAEILEVLELLAKYPGFISGVLQILAEAPQVIPAVVAYVKAPSAAGLQALLTGNAAVAQKLMATLNSAAQADPTFIPTVAAVVK